MSKNYFVFFIVFSILFNFTVFSQSDNENIIETGNLIITVTGLKNNSGDLKIGLFNTDSMAVEIKLINF